MSAGSPPSGIWAGAVALFEQTFSDCLRVPGADHPTTKLVKANLAAVRNRHG